MEAAELLAAPVDLSGVGKRSVEMSLRRHHGGRSRRRHSRHARLRLRLARLRRLVRLQGRHSPAGARGHRRRLSLQPRRQGRKASTIGAVPPRSATTTRWPATSRQPAARASGQSCAASAAPSASAKQGKAPATADLISQMVALCPDNMIGKRDRALLCLGFAGAFRRSELCALEVADLTEVAGRAADPDPAQQGRSGRAGAGGGHPGRLPPAPRRGRAVMARCCRMEVPECFRDVSSIKRHPGKKVARDTPPQD